MRRRVTLHLTAIAHVTGLVDVPDAEPVEGDEITEEQRVERDRTAAAEAGARAAADLRDRFGTIMTGRWPELLHGADIEVSLAAGAPETEVEVHPIV